MDMAAPLKKSEFENPTSHVGPKYVLDKYFMKVGLWVADISANKHTGRQTTFK